MTATFSIRIAASAIAMLVGATGVFAADNSPTAPGGDDCYNRVTRQCNVDHPGKDYGDASYKKCIDDGLDACDVNEPVGKVGGKLGGFRFTQPKLKLHKMSFR